MNSVVNSYACYNHYELIRMIVCEREQTNESIVGIWQIQFAVKIYRRFLLCTVFVLFTDSVFVFDENGNEKKAEGKREEKTNIKKLLKPFSEPMQTIYSHRSIAAERGKLVSGDEQLPFEFRISQTI